MRRIGVCSWSLRPSGPSDLVGKLRECAIGSVQLALDPLRTGAWDEGDTARHLREAGITIVSGMMAMKGEDYSTLESIRRTGGVRPDEQWEANLHAAQANAALARRLGVALVTFHAGFLPHDPADSERAVMIERLQRLCDVFAGEGVKVAFETGQETAATLAEVLRELARLAAGVNFDPANMILYGMGDPVEALRDLAPWVRQVHVKDALATTTPGTWGRESPVGHGAVNWKSFFRVLEQVCPGVDLVIEREGGDRRIEEVRAARDLIDRHLRP